MENPIFQRPLNYHLTPQYKRNKKTLQFSKLNLRISLLKHQIKKQKHQSSLQLAHLKHINQLTESFEKKVITQITKCKQLKEVNLNTDKDPDSQSSRQCGLLNEINAQSAPYERQNNNNNSDGLNSKKYQNAQLYSIQSQRSLSTSTSSLPQKIQKIEEIHNTRLNKTIKKKCKRTTLSALSSNNLFSKEIFLTSIVFLILFTLFMQIFSLT